MEAAGILEMVKVATEGGLGAISLALFFKLGQVVANHEIRITKVEGDVGEVEDKLNDLSVVRRKRRRSR